MDFIQDFLVEARNWLAFLGIRNVHAGTTLGSGGSIKHVAVPLSDVPDDKIGVDFFRIRARLPKATPRKVKQAHSMTASLSPDEAQGLAMLISEVEKGHSLLPRLSKTWQRGQEDGLLNDWGMHHFHLGVSLEQNGSNFINRSENVVIALLSETTFYIVDIKPHGGLHPAPWPMKELLETIDREWPGLLNPYEMGIKLIHDFSDDQTVTAMRKLGVLNLIEINDRTLMPLGGGVASDGGSSKAVQLHNSEMYHIKILQQDWERLKPGVKAELRYMPNDMFAIQDGKGRLWIKEVDSIGQVRFSHYPDAEKYKSILKRNGLWRHIAQ